MDEPSEENPITVDQFTRIATPIRPWCGELALPHATGFLWTYRQHKFLVSNWHVFSGRDAITGQPLLSHGGCPDRVTFEVNMTKSADLTQLATAEMPIVRNGENLWLEHPTLGQAIDVAAVRLPSAAQLQDLLTLSDIPETLNMKVYVGQDVFILGYPLDPELTTYLPIWKRGTIATEPSHKISGLPKMLVDSAVRPGMSGAPVIARILGNYLTTDGGFTFWSSEANRRIGVYSGRLGTDLPDKVQLGIVWRMEVVDEICGGNKTGEVRLT